jgi:enoyl-CoA hydratase/carnithine racemase
MIDAIEHGSIRELRMNRPPVNALDPGLLAAISGELQRAVDDGREAIVLSGQEGMFTAGLDIPVLLKLNDDEMRHAVRLFFEGMETVVACPIPIAAAITGHSPAGGAVFSIFCDWRVMADGEYVFGFNEVAVGITMPSVVHAAITYAAGPRYAELMCVTGRMVGPREAMAMGLVDRVAQPEDVVPMAVGFCQELLALPRRAMEQTRTLARRELIEFVREHRRRDGDFFFQEWKRPETRKPLEELVERLAKKKRQKTR